MKEDRFEHAADTPNRPAGLPSRDCLNSRRSRTLNSHPARPARSVQPSLVQPSPATIDFRDIATEADLTAENVSGDADNKRYILETTGDGVAIFDLDNDGLMDILLVNATTMDGKGRGEKSTSHLYRNLGNLHFVDITQKAGLGKVGWGQGVCAGDYDNDGYEDLFVTYYGHSVLYHNEGNGTFKDVTEAAGLKSDASPLGHGLFVLRLRPRRQTRSGGHRLRRFDRSKIPEPGSGGYCQWKGMPVMCGPRGLPSGRSFLFHNDGKGKFSDVSMASGIGKPTGCYGFTVLASDFDNDGYPDLYMSCDSRPSLLYHNRKNGTFEEIGVASGVALSDAGQEQAGMGVTASDYDEDGLSISRRQTSATTCPISTTTMATARLPTGCTNLDWERTRSIWAGAFSFSTSITTGARTL